MNKKTLTIRLNEDFFLRLGKHCKSIQKTKAGLLRDLLKEYLDAEDSKQRGEK